MLICEYATQIAKETLSTCSAMIDHMLKNLLDLALCYRTIAFVFTMIGDFYTYRTELLD